MKKNFPWKGLLAALILLLLAAGAVTVAWFAKNPPDFTPDPPVNSVGSVLAGSTHTVTQSLTELSGATEVTDPEYSDVTGTETGTGTDTETNVTDEGSITETVDTATQTEITSTEEIQTSTLPPESTSETPPPVDTSPKKVAFTFDDGPYAPVTRGIADEFAKYGGRCTYFVIGNRVYGQQAEAMKYAASLGNEIGIHGYTHTIYFNECAESDYLYELQATADVIRNNIGVSPVLMRPPGGFMTNDRVAACAYSVLLWNVDTKDWKYKKESQANIDVIVQNILSDISDGDIVLMHDIYNNTYEAIKIVLPILKEQGYEFVTVSELLGENRKPGTKYRYAY